jgi:hypothetical protein
VLFSGLYQCSGMPFRPTHAPTIDPAVAGVTSWQKLP